MKITVIFTNALAKVLKTPKLLIDANTYRDVVSAVINLLPNSKILATENVMILSGNKIISKQELDFKIKLDTIYMVPVISGGNNSGFDSLGNLLQFYGTTTALGNQEMALTGLNRRVLESSLFGKSKIAYDIAQRAANRSNNLQENVDDPSTGFGSLNISSINGQNVPLIFGRARVAGVLIGQHVKHIQRAGIDDIKVTDYI